MGESPRTRKMRQGLNIQRGFFVLITIGSIVILFNWKATFDTPGAINFVYDDVEARLNIVYIKTHKCASETLSLIFRRFGQQRNLSFVLPAGARNNLGWPDKLEPGMYRPSKTGQYNILCEHTVFDEEIMAKLMPNDTVYVTSIREPFSHLMSAFRYFDVGKIVRIKGPNVLGKFLSNLQKYDNVYKSAAVAGLRRKSCVPTGLSVTQNSIAFDLGYPVGYYKNTTSQMTNQTAIDQWIRALDRRFALVILVEYFDASLVLLRRLLKWSTKDIVYFKRNTQKYNHTGRTFKQSSIEKYRRWSAVDFALYEHFNRTLWMKISREVKFWDEVEHFSSINKLVRTFCGKKKTLKATDVMTVNATLWHDAFNLTRHDCFLLSNRLMMQLKQQYDRNPTIVSRRKITGSAC